jgi:hypothetical protein
VMCPESEPARGPSLLRRLRIALSVLSFGACLGFVCLWIRSYYFCDTVTMPLPMYYSVHVQSLQGTVIFAPYNTWGDPQSHQWESDPERIPDDPGVPVLFDMPPTFRGVSIPRGSGQALSVPYDTGDHMLLFETPPTFRWAPFPMGSGHVFSLPHWFFAVIAGLSSIAWRPPPRFRFSIRELLILTTLTAVVLGTVAAFSR